MEIAPVALALVVVLWLAMVNSEPSCGAGGAPATEPNRFAFMVRDSAVTRAQRLSVVKYGVSACALEDHVEHGVIRLAL